MRTKKCEVEEVRCQVQSTKYTKNNTILYFQEVRKFRDHAKAKFQNMTTISQGEGIRIAFKMLSGHSTNYVFQPDSTVKVNYNDLLLIISVISNCQDLYEFVARDVDPPFTLRTHSQVTLSLDRSEVVKLASTDANELLHVVCGGSAELF